MKNYIAVIITILFFICPSICFSSYLIELKNGSTFITNHYWKEGGQVKFYCRGGVVGIEKDLVREIRESDLPYIVKKPQPEKEEEEAKTESEYKPESEQKKEAFIEEKMRIATEIESVSAAFREAKAKNNRKQMQVERKKLLSLRTELSKLRENVMAKHGGQVPAW